MNSSCLSQEPFSSAVIGSLPQVFPTASQHLCHNLGQLQDLGTLMQSSSSAFPPGLPPGPVRSCCSDLLWKFLSLINPGINGLYCSLLCQFGFYLPRVKERTAVLFAQSCPVVYNPMTCESKCSFVHGTLQNYWSGLLVYFSSQPGTNLCLLSAGATPLPPEPPELPHFLPSPPCHCSPRLFYTFQLSSCFGQGVWSDWGEDCLMLPGRKKIYSSTGWQSHP